MVFVFLIRLAVFLFPHSNEFFLPFLSAFEVLWVLGLFKRMPIVKNPVRGSDHTLMCYTSDTGGN